MSSSNSSGWERWDDLDGTLHVKITLTADDQRKVGPRTWEMLQEAGRMIQAALAEPD